MYLMTGLQRALAVFALLAFMFIPNISKAYDFKIPALTDYWPYSTYSVQDGWEGYGIDLVNRLIQSEDEEHTVSYIINPSWSRSVRSIEHGIMDFLWEVSYSEEREKSMEFIGVTDIERWMFVVPETFEVDVITDLDQLFEIQKHLTGNFRKIFYTEEYVYPKIFSDRMKSDPEFAALFETDTLITTIMGDDVWPGLLVALGKVPIRMNTETDANAAVAKSALLVKTNPHAKRLKAVPITPMEAGKTHLVVPKSMEDKYKQMIISNFKQAREDGSFEEIWNKWFKNKEMPPIE